MANPAPAPTFQALYDFETQIEKAFLGVFQADPIVGGPTQVVASHSPQVLRSPRVELQFVTGPSEEWRTIQNGFQTPQGFMGTLTIRVVTTRTFDAWINFHGQIRGRVRYLCSAPAAVISYGTNLPWLQIVELLPVSMLPLVTDEKDQDISGLEYGLRFSINDWAWPVT